jgi:hypothetical protein
MLSSLLIKFTLLAAIIAVVAAGWDQCGGDSWIGPRICVAGYACYTRSVYFSQVSSS